VLPSTGAIAQSVFELQYCEVFHKYVQCSLAAGITKSVLEFVRVFVGVMDDVPSHEVDVVSNNNRFSHLNKTLQKLSSSVLLAEFLRSLCTSNFDFVCFLARSTVEQCRLYPGLAGVSAQSILSPVALALRDICLDSATTVRLGSAIVKCRALVFEPGSPLTIVSEPMFRRLTHENGHFSPQYDVRHVIKTVRALIVATASTHQLLLKDALLFELQQAVILHGDSIQASFSLEHEVFALWGDSLSFSAAFAKLSAEQIVLTFAPIFESMQTSFQSYGEDVPRCIDVVTSALACTLFVAFLKLKGAHAQLSGASAAQLSRSIPAFSKWFSFFMTRFLINTFLEPAPLSLLFKNRTFVRCTAPATLNKKLPKSISKVSTLQQWRGESSRNDISKFVLDGSVKFSDFSTLRGSAFNRSELHGYYEVKVKEAGRFPQFGFCTLEFQQNASEKNNGCGDDAYSWGWDGQRKLFWCNGETAKSEIQWTAGDCLGFEVDFTCNTTRFSKNGKLLHEHVFSGSIDTLLACITAKTGDYTVNFGTCEYPPRLPLVGATAVCNRAAAYPIRAISKILESRPHVSSESCISNHQTPQAKLEHQLWVAVSRQQPLFADTITLDLLERRSFVELHDELSVPAQLERSIEESCRANHVVSSCLHVFVLIQNLIVFIAELRCPQRFCVPRTS